MQIFVHGGNWQELTKESSAFAAPEILRSGAAFAVVNYGLVHLTASSAGRPVREDAGGVGVCHPRGAPAPRPGETQADVAGAGARGHPSR